MTVASRNLGGDPWKLKFVADGLDLSACNATLTIPSDAHRLVGCGARWCHICVLVNVDVLMITHVIPCNDTCYGSDPGAGAGDMHKCIDMAPVIQDQSVHGVLL